MTSNNNITLTLSLFLCLACSSTAMAEKVRFTFTGSVSSSSDTAGILPFSQPLPDTPVVYSFVVDTSSILDPGPNNIAIYLDSSAASFSYSGVSISASFSTGPFVGSNSLGIVDDVSTAIRLGLYPQNTYIDGWFSPMGTFDNGNAGFEFGVDLWTEVGKPVFSVDYPPTYYIPQGPITDAYSYFVPDLSDWEGKEIYFRAISDGQLSTLTATVHSLTVTPVPVPAAVWLFCSALLSLASFKRRAA